jgi:hypothetical protein
MKRHPLVLGIALLFFAHGSARAGAILQFGTPVTGSPSLSYAGGNTALTGTGFAVATTFGDGTSMNNGETLTVTGGQFNFSTGLFAKSTSTEWIFNGGGAFAMTGGIASIGIPNGSNLLFDGRFLGQVTVTKLGGNYDLQFSELITLINPTLAENYGLPPNAEYFGELGILFQANHTSPGQPFTSVTIDSVDIAVEAIPEPASLTLAGVGILSLVGVSWRVRRRS